MSLSTGRAARSVHSASSLAKTAHPSVLMTSVMESLVVSPPVTPDVSTDAQITPVRIGFLSDMPAGTSLAEYLDPIILAIEDSINEGRLGLPIDASSQSCRGTANGRSSQCYRHPP
jgi:hypothetical protein